MMARRLTRMLLVVTLLGTTVACGPVELPTVMVVGEGSSLTMTPNPPMPVVSTDLSGGMETTVTVDVDLLRLMWGLPLRGTIAVDDVVVAGTSVDVNFPPFVFPTGTICTFLDPEGTAGGTISISLIRKRATIEASADTSVHFTGELANSLLGVIPLTLPISAKARVTLLDLLGALGGSGLDLEFSQEIDTQINHYLLGPIHVTGVLNLSTQDAIPEDPLVLECMAL